MDQANGIPGKVPERRPPTDTPAGGPTPPDLEPPLPEPPQEDGVVRVLRRVPMYAFIVFLGVVAADFVFPGVKVVVHNEGPGAMRNVTLSVKSETTPLEPIAEGAEGSTRFRLWGDAPIFLAYTDEDGKTIQLEGGEHRFTRMCGTVRISVRKGKADVAELP